MKNKEVLVSTELAFGLTEVLESALTKGQLTGREGELAAAYAHLLKKQIAASQKNERVSISIELVANILRIILMILLPDPIIRGLVAFLGGLH